MTDAAGLDLGVYRPEDSDEALALERQCMQGTSYRLSFRRPVFHARAETYAEWRIVTARWDGTLVGLAAAAIKSVELRGESLPAAFFFDLRVHPGFRGRGIARRLGAELYRWSGPRSALKYTFAMAENRPAAGVFTQAGAVDSGGFAYLVYPAYRPGNPWPAVTGVALEDVHDAMKRVAGPFDFYARPAVGTGTGYVGSWMVRHGADRAGCSAWSHADVLAEVVEAVPRAVRLAGRMVSAWPLRLGHWPHLPEPGERLRSWYLFDWFATDAAVATRLMRHVAGEARARGVDYCYVVHGPSDGWIHRLRADIPRCFSPLLRYRLWVDLPARLAGPLHAVYVDVRDL